VSTGADYLGFAGKAGKRLSVVDKYCDRHLFERHLNGLFQQPGSTSVHININESRMPRLWSLQPTSVIFAIDCAEIATGNHCPNQWDNRLGVLPSRVILPSSCCTVGISIESNLGQTSVCRPTHTGGMKGLIADSR